ncbi:MAG: tRNA pseudouridine(55) synthase TruB [bacterium]|nr:tRNA pseudouridine(55) synthase TruB [bacterium]
MDSVGEGMIAVWKPAGMSSHDVINRVRRASGIRTVGHAGTLDPLARGVLVIGVGRTATRGLAAEVQKEKEYVTTVRLGVTSSTDDEEGEKTPHEVTVIPTREAVELAAQKFVGEIMQVPPIYSALKIKGKPAYAYAREGKDLVMAARPVRVVEIEVLSYDYPDIRLRAVTGAGVYVRSLARDIGAALGTGAYMADLERTRVGEFTKDRCIQL